MRSRSRESLRIHIPNRGWNPACQERGHGCGAMYAAGMLGVTHREMLGAVEAVYEELMGG